MNEASLSAFIEAQRNAGTVESAGSFTLAIEKARDKLASYTLAKPEDYILKLVQCAVLLGVDELFIELQRTAVLYYFEVPEDNHQLAIEKLTESLFSPLEDSHRGRSHLSLALCAIAAERPVELMWGEWGPESSQILSLGHGRSELFRNPPFPRTEPLAPDRRFHLLYFKKPSSGVPLSLTSAESRVLRERCSFAPIPISLDGKRLEPCLPSTDIRIDPVLQMTSLYLGALRLETEGACQLHWPPSSGKATFLTPLPDSLQALCPGLPPALIVDLPEGCPTLTKEFYFSCLYGVSCYLDGPSLLHYQKDGVLMEPVKGHDAGAGAFSILGGDHLKTDVSGLRVVEDEKVSKDLDAAVFVWKELIDRFMSNDPVIFQNNLVASGKNMVERILSQKYLQRTVKPFYDYFAQTEHQQAMDLKRFLRQLKTRRVYLAFFRDPD